IYTTYICTTEFLKPYFWFIRPAFPKVGLFFNLSFILRQCAILNYSSNKKFELYMQNQKMTCVILKKF
ncbi:hypothetical protein C7E21_10965, partial [Acinetobacter radioresistens]